jgi:hypothetical protein
LAHSSSWATACTNSSPSLKLVRLFKSKTLADHVQIYKTTFKCANKDATLDYVATPEPVGFDLRPHAICSFLDIPEVVTGLRAILVQPHKTCTKLTNALTCRAKGLCLTWRLGGNKQLFTSLFRYPGPPALSLRLPDRIATCPCYYPEAGLGYGMAGFVRAGSLWAGNGLIWTRELILYTLCILSWMYGRGENGNELSALGWRLLFVHWGGYGIV